MLNQIRILIMTKYKFKLIKEFIIKKMFNKVNWIFLWEEVNKVYKRIRLKRNMYRIKQCKVNCKHRNLEKLLYFYKM